MSAKATPVSLSKISGLVFRALQDSGDTSFEAVSNIVIAQIDAPEAKNDQRTIKRRVYDVLNVMTALGYIEKSNRVIRMNRSGAPFAAKCSASRDAVEAQLAAKEAQLADKIRILMYYKLLIERNKKAERPNGAVQFPAIFVGFRDAASGEIKKSLDGKEVQIVTSVSPLLFSPLNMLEAIGFPAESQLEFLRSLPNGGFLEELLFRDRAKEQPQEQQ